MATVIIDDTNLTSIAAAIREKNGTTDTYKPNEMSTAILAIETGGGSIPEEAFNITGSCNYRFAYNGWSWFVNAYKNKITTEEITNATYMFYNSNQITQIPFDLNFAAAYDVDLSYLFTYCGALESIGKITNVKPTSMSYMFGYCSNLRYLPTFENLDMSYIRAANRRGFSNLFNGCSSLRSIPEEFLKELYNPLNTSALYHLFYCGFQNCYALDEIRGLNPQTGTLTSNAFSSTFINCGRLKDIIFATQEDGTPYTVNWSNQTIDLASGYMGIVGSATYVTGYNAGITADKEVTDDATYAALKDDPDWWTTSLSYSRYNHDSAVNTINSLPDASSGSGNTIKFYQVSGSNTDGGAIGNLTEEEIAVAAAKGWTVTLTL